MSAPARRAYRSDRRQAQATQTRTQVVAAATELFGRRGWAGTAMRDVAEAAGVAVETVYAHARSKRDLLLMAIDVGVVGDTEPVPLAQRPEFAALARGDREQRLAAAAAMLAGINSRSWGLRRALCEATRTEPVLAARQDELERRRRHDIGIAAAMVLGRPLTDGELDAVWVLGNAETFAALTESRGLTRADYEAWLATMIDRLVPQARGEREGR